MPSPKRINARVVWDRLELDEAFAALPSNDTPGTRGTKTRLRRVQQHAHPVQAHRYRDRHGNIRIYARVPGRRKVRIRAPFGTDVSYRVQSCRIPTFRRPPANPPNRNRILPAFLPSLPTQPHLQTAGTCHPILAAADP